MAGADNHAMSIAHLGVEYSKLLDSYIATVVTQDEVVDFTMKSMNKGNEDHLKILCNELKQKCYETKDIKGVAALGALFGWLYYNLSIGMIGFHFDRHLPILKSRKYENDKEHGKKFFTQFAGLIQKDYETRELDAFRCLASLPDSKLDMLKPMAQAFEATAKKYSESVDSICKISSPSKFADMVILARNRLLKGLLDTKEHRDLLISGQGSREHRLASLRILQAQAEIRQ